MKDRPLTFTRFPGFDSIDILFFCARESYFIGEFKDKALESLPHPSLTSRSNVINDFLRIFLRSPVPREDPMVLLWEKCGKKKTRREIALIKLQQTFPIVESFVVEFLYPLLFLKKDVGLFDEEKSVITNEEINRFLSKYLQTVSPTTFRATRNTLRFLLTHVGLLSRSEENFPKSWLVKPYRPEFVSWLFSLLEEGGEEGVLNRRHLKTPKRLLMPPPLEESYLRRTVKEGWGFFEQDKLCLKFDLAKLAKRIS
jgi:hypothetical protein